MPAHVAKEREHRGEGREEERDRPDRVRRVVRPRGAQRVDDERNGEGDREVADCGRLVRCGSARGPQLVLAPGDAQPEPAQKAAGDHAVERDEEEVRLAADLNRQAERQDREHRDRERGRDALEGRRGGAERRAAQDQRQDERSRLRGELIEALLAPDLARRAARPRRPGRRPSPRSDSRGSIRTSDAPVPPHAMSAPRTSRAEALTRPPPACTARRRQHVALARLTDVAYADIEPLREDHHPVLLGKRHAQPVPARLDLARRRHRGRPTAQVTGSSSSSAIEAASVRATTWSRPTISTFASARVEADEELDLGGAAISSNSLGKFVTSSARSGVRAR